MVCTAKDYNLALLGKVPRSSEGLQISLGARVCEAQFRNVEACTYGAGESLLGGYGAAEVEADVVNDTDDGVFDEGGRVAVEGSGELPSKVGISCFLSECDSSLYEFMRGAG